MKETNFIYFETDGKLYVPGWSSRLIEDWFRVQCLFSMLGSKAITKARFFEVAEQYGWYFRTVSHLHDSEDQVRGNLELMKLDK